MSTTPDPRHVARAIALQRLFAFTATKSVPPPANSLVEELGVDDYDHDLANRIYTGVVNTLAEIDPIIQEHAPAWPLEQIAPVDLIILRIAIWEGFISKTTPIKVVINEAIELAKEFGGENSGAFINGVLGALFKIEAQNDEETE